MIVRMQRSPCGRRFTARFAEPVRVWSVMHNCNQAHERATIDSIPMGTHDVKQWPPGRAVEIAFGDPLKCCDVEVLLDH